MPAARVHRAGKMRLGQVYPEIVYFRWKGGDALTHMVPPSPNSKISILRNFIMMHMNTNKVLFLFLSTANTSYKHALYLWPIDNIHVLYFKMVAVSVDHTH